MKIRAARRCAFCASKDANLATRNAFIFELLGAATFAELSFLAIAVSSMRQAEILAFAVYGSGACIAQHRYPFTYLLHSGLLGATLTWCFARQTHFDDLRLRYVLMDQEHMLAISQ
jgi:hypothetical protein